MSFQVHECQQGTPEWHAARAGAITASNFHLAMDKAQSGKNKGGYKEAAYDYAFRVAAERIAGESLDEGFETWAMRRGHELEVEARSLHALMIEADISPTGVVTTEDAKFGASADGLIGTDGGAEYKCLIDPSKLRRILFDGDIDDFRPQVQGGMWITGRKWWDFVLYCPALRGANMDFHLERIWRDDEYIERMERELVTFDQLVEEYRQRLIHQGETNQRPTPAPKSNAAAGAFGA